MTYIIGQNTLFMYYDGKSKTVVNEQATDLVFASDLLEQILEDSCMYYGSSYKGRIDGAKNILECKYKIPIIISELNSLIFFPINGAKNQEKFWINFGMVKNYKKKGKFVHVTFNNGYEKDFFVSYTIFNNQMLKCSRLWLVYLSRV